MKQMSIAYRIALLMMILSLPFLQALSQSGRLSTKRASGQAGGDLSQRAVFNPPQLVWGRMQDECRGPSAIECVVSIMREAGASDEAMAFTRRIDGDGFMDSFREMGKVDLATAFYPFRANTNEGIFIVNGSPSMIDVADLDRWGKIDIRTDALYPTIARRFPEVTLWGGGAGLQTMQRLSHGGQRFVFSYNMTNGCRACDVAGYAHVAFDFDKEGRFLGARLLRLTRAGKTRYQHPSKRRRIGSGSNRAGTNVAKLPLVAHWDGKLLTSSRDGQFFATQIEREGNNYTTKIWQPGGRQSILTLDGRFSGFSPDKPIRLHRI